MNQLRRRALARLPLTEAEVERLYTGRSEPTRSYDMVSNLCESHERLRAELQGAEILLEDMRREVKSVVADLEGGPGCDVWVRCLTKLRELIPES